MALGWYLLKLCSCGLPVIASTNTGGKDLLELDGSIPSKVKYGGSVCLEYPAGWIIPTRSPETLSSIFQFILENPQALIQKKSAALRLRNENISWNSYASSLCLTYASLLEREAN